MNKAAVALALSLLLALGITRWLADQHPPFSGSARDTVAAKPAASPQPSSGAQLAGPLSPLSVQGGSPTRANTGAIEPILLFRRWAEQYTRESPEARQHLLEEGMALADAHRTALKQLIAADPEQALASAVPMVLRQQLPAAIRERLERRLSGRGRFEVLAVSPDSAPSEPLFRRFATLEGEELNARVYASRLSQPTTENALLHGIAIDREFAISEQRLRVLEVGEKPDPGKELINVCPISKITLPLLPTEQPISEETPAVESGSQIFYLCDGGHIRVLEEELIASEGLTGGPGSPLNGLPVTKTSSTGVRRFLYMRVVFPDRLHEPQTEKDAWTNCKTLTDYFQENSYGRCSFMGTVTPVIVLPRTEAWYVQDYNTTKSNSPIMNDAKEVARSLGFPADDYQHFVCLYSGGPGSFGGLGSVGGGNTWLKTTSVGTFEHEFGHNVGVWHSNFWNTSGRDVIGSGANSEYGHVLDVMGSSGSGGHFNASMKEQLQWLVPEVYHTVLKSGTYRIFQTDQVLQDGARRYALKVAKDTDRDYWLEFRQRHATNPWFHNGISINWSPWGNGTGQTNSTAQGSNAGTQLLDMTPGSPDDRNDSPLVIGRTFTDPAAGIHITPLSKNGTAPESLDVVVNVGPFTDNTAPTLSIAADNLTISPGGTINFTATANDSEGDTLAYSWNFGDKLASFNGSSFSTNNAANQAKVYANAGYYNVQCTVSDMKGGTITRSLLVQVGTPGTFYIEGTVTDDAQPLAGVRMSNNLTGTNWRGGLTDSDGIYRITNVASGDVTLTALQGGLAFTPAFLNPIAVTENQTGKDWTAADSLPRVSLEIVDGDAGEDSNPDTAVWRISRTGSTDVALTVSTDFQGTASPGDYTLSPTADTTTTTPLEVFTIPVGSSYLDILLTPNDDSTQEGPETFVASLINAPGYLPAGPQTAAITLQDNDTTKPLVKIVSNDPEAAEGTPADTAQFTFSRTGPTTGDLMINFTITSGAGHAVNGTDYSTADLTAQIPAGNSSTTVTITPLDDAVVEGLESITLTVASSQNYLTAAPTTVTAKLIDDDINVISITATDATANENGDPGRFTVTRTGDPALPLLVPYGISGDATHGVDYQSLAGVVSFPAGSGVATIDILPINDRQGEPAQTIILQLRSANLYQLSTSNRATVTLNDDGDLPAVNVNLTDGVVVEGATADPGQFRITTTGTGSGNITVNYTVTGTATSGVDFTALTGSISIGKNTTANIALAPLNDALPEDTETVTVTLTPHASYTLDLQDRVTAAIRDDDKPTVSISANSLTMSELSAGKFYVHRTGSTTNPLTVNYTVTGTAVSGEDYAALSGDLTIPAAASGAFVDVTPLEDTQAEGTETIVLMLTPDAGYGLQNAAATLQITDNDSGFTTHVGFAGSGITVAENAGSAFITVNRSGNTTTVCAVDYGIVTSTAHGSGIDFTLATGTLNFAPGETAKNIPFTISDDGLPEEPEAFVVQLRNASGAAITSNATQHSVIIIDNEPGVNIQALDPFAHESTPDTASFRITRTGSTAQSLTVPLVFSGTATNGTDVTSLPASLTIPAGATFIDRTIFVTTDSLTEPVETLIISIGESGNYRIGDKSSASVFIGNESTDDPPMVAILSPGGSAPGVSVGAQLILEGVASDDGTITTVWSKQSGPSGVTFENINAASTTAVFTASGTYVLRLTAHDGSLSSFAEVSIVVGGAVSPWATQNIGNTTLPGTSAQQWGTHILVGGGTSLSGTMDNFLLRHRSLTGDGSLTARVRSTTLSSSAARIGITMRESNSATSKMAAMAMAPANGNLSAFQYRSSTGGSASASTASGLSPSHWVRLTRTGNNISAFDSPDGQTWTQRGTSQNIVMSPQVLVGLASMSANGSRLNIALIDKLSLTGVPGNLGATVNAGPDATVLLTQDMSVPLAGNFTDDALTSGTVVEWQQLSGPDVTTFVNGDKPNASAVVKIPGTYVYRMTVDDGELRTFDKVTITATSPIHDWRVSEFGGNAGIASISGDLVDYDKDGTVNLLEYAFITDPEIVSLPAITMDSTATHQRLTYVRRTNTPDISYQVQWSNDLQNWQSNGVTEEVLATNGLSTTVRAQAPVAPGTPRFFMRVLVTRF